MSKQPSLPFEGSLLDATGYHMSIIDTSAIYRAILNNKRALEEEYRIAWDETEELYAWCVVQAISDAFREHRVLGHYHNSLYMEVYDGLILGYHCAIRTVIEPVLENLPSIKAIRVLPLLDKTVLAILQ